MFIQEVVRIKTQHVVLILSSPITYSSNARTPFDKKWNKHNSSIEIEIAKHK